MWRDEKTEYLRRNRDYARLLDGDDAGAQTPRAQNGGRSKDRQLVADEDDDGPERQEYLSRRQRLKELERQKLTKGKNGLHASSARDEVSKAGEQSKSHGVSRNGGDLSLPKDKKKLPYDRSFGSFFGPSQPVVAKRIIEEARAREEAEIVAARNATASLEAERKKSVASLSARKISLDRKPPKAKPVDKTTEKARKLKEARDYSFLFDDSPLPGPKEAAREGPAPSKLGVEKHYSAFVQANNHPPRKISSDQVKHILGSRGADGSTKSSIPSQSQSKSSQPSRSLPRQGLHDRYPSDRSAIQSSSAKQSTSKVSSAGPGRPDLRKVEDLRKEAMLREFVSGSVASNGKKSNAQIVDRNPTHITDRHHPQGSALPPPRQADRPPSRAAERLPSRATSAQSADKLPSRATSAKAADRLPSRATSAHAADRLPSRATYAQAADRLPSRATSSQATDRLPSRATSAQAADRLPSRATSSQAADRLPSRVTSSQAADRLPSRPTSAHAADRRPTQPGGRLSIQLKDTGMAKASERGPVTLKGLKKGAPKSANYRAGAAREEPRRQISASQKPASKAASRPALSDHTRGTRYSEDSWRGEPRPHKRARSSSEESDERPRSRNKLPTIGVNKSRSVGRGARSPSEEDDDSFIDDDDDPGNVSSMIHSIMGYNPNKYRGNDDIDDRTMEVGFRTIEAEERRSAREARLEDERELALIEAEEREERLRKAKRKRR